MAIIDVPVKMRCQRCKQDVPPKDAFVVVYQCYEKKNGDIIQIPNRAFHFNFVNGKKCMGEIDITVEEK